MKRILTAVFLILFVTGLFSSCSKKAKFKDVEYKENGISFTLPNTMVREEVFGYEFYFSGMSRDVVFNAIKITDEFLISVDIEPGVSAGEYVDIIIEKNGLEKTKLYFSHDEESGQYNFRYTYDDNSGYETFFYATVLGTPDNLWYVEMCCSAEESYEHLELFESWRKTIRTYS